VLYHIQLGTVSNSEDWLELEGFPEVDAQNLSFLLVHFHLVAISKEFQLVQIILQLVGFVIKNGASVFMELERPWPVRDVKLDERFAKVDGSGLRSIIYIFDCAGR
jgi:hypothetical protein